MGNERDREIVSERNKEKNSSRAKDERGRKFVLIQEIGSRIFLFLPLSLSLFLLLLERMKLNP